MKTDATLNFVNHHVHSHYSIMDCITKVDELVDKVHGRGGKYVTITDHGSIASTYELWKFCNKKDMTPILGCECYFIDSYEDPGALIPYNYGHIVVLCMNEIGWKNLKKLHHIAWESGFLSKPRIQLTDLCKYNEGLIITTGCMRGPVGWDYLGNDKHYGELSEQDRDKRLYRRCKKLKEAFGDRFYDEIQVCELEQQISLNKKVLKVSKKLDMEVIVTGDSHYLCKGDSRVHDAMICIGRKEKLNDESNSTYPTDQLWLKTPEELEKARKKWHKDYLSEEELVKCIRNTEVIAGRVSKYPIRPVTSSLPVLYTDPSAQVLKICKEHRDAKLLNRKEYKERFEYEFSVIEKLGFLNYFLVVWDIAQYARKNDITYNARGSVCGSLVAYLMGITWIDPIKFDIIFERFLTEDRISLPDIDMDFSSTKREMVVKYVQERYGHECVVHICNYLKWKPKQAFKDVGRILEHDFQSLNMMTRTIDDEGVEDWDEFVKNDKISEFLTNNEDVEPLAKSLLGVIRQQGIHASGVVVTPGPCVDWLPVSYRTDKSTSGDKKSTKVTEWDMYALEDLNILKLDFLGVNQLDIVGRAIELICRRHENPGFKNLDELYAVLLADNCGDKAVLKMIVDQDTIGTFQLGTSDGMKALGRDLKVENIHEVIAMIALYRTAVLEAKMHVEFVQRKFGKSYSYLHPKMEKVLEKTRGVLLYQEQVSTLTQVLAGFTGTEADHFRKAIKLKDSEKFALQKKKFIDGCLTVSNIKPHVAEKIWGFIEKFAGYGFNLAHAASYGVFAYLTAWLKHHYRIEYMTAVLSCNANDDKKLYVYISDIKKSGHKMLAPNINVSTQNFRIIKENIMYPIESVKNVGEKAWQNILSVRKGGGKFQSFDEFLDRVNKRVVNVRVVNNLILSGAFRDFGTKEEVFDSFRQGSKEKVCRQLACRTCKHRYPVTIKELDISSVGCPCPNCGDVEVVYERGGSLPDSYRKYKFDKRYIAQHVFGFSLEESQLKNFADVIIKERCVPMPTIEDIEEGSPIKIAFEIKKIKSFIDKNQNEMAFIDITDGEYESSLTIFSKEWADLKPYIKEGACYAARLIKNRGKLLYSIWKQCEIKRLVNNFRGE